MRRMYSENQLLKAVETESQEHGLKVFENIVDKEGHPRFIEGEITTSNEDVNLTYGKWSLSGSHFLIVFAGTIANGKTIQYGTIIDQIVVPNWIYDKLYPIYSNIITYKVEPLFNSSGVSQNMVSRLTKNSNGTLGVANSTDTMTDDRNFRFSFDLLIDNN